MAIFVVIGWFILGFVVAATLLYGPVMAKALAWQLKGNASMKDAIRKIHESTEMNRHAAVEAKAYGAQLQGLAKLQKDHIALQTKYGDHLEKHTQLQREHLALLKKLDADK